MELRAYGPRQGYDAVEVMDVTSQVPYPSEARTSRRGYPTHHRRKASRTRTLVVVSGVGHTALCAGVGIVLRGGSLKLGSSPRAAGANAYVRANACTRAYSHARTHARPRACTAAKGGRRPPPPPTSYHCVLTMLLPYIDLAEPMEVWTDADRGSQRIDYWGGVNQVWRASPHGGRNAS